MDPPELWVALRNVAGLGPRQARPLLERFGSPREVFRQRRERLEALVPAPTAREIARGPDLEAAREELERARRCGLAVCVYADQDFPPLLRLIADPPLVLYRKGALPQPPAVAMVGSRRATARGRQVAGELACDLARAGAFVVSGLAYGIDAAAHEGALAGGGSTVAVLASGLDRPSPGGNRGLARRILAQGGAWLSEQPPGSASLPGHFPERNRLISGLAPVTVVVEARERSGSLWTASHAIEQGRELLAVPGPIDTDACRGSNRLLRDGAHPVLEPDDVITALGRRIHRVLRKSTTAPPRAQRTPEASSILHHLRGGPADPDQLARALGHDAPRLAALLLELELDGAIARDGRRIALAGGPGPPRKLS